MDNILKGIVIAAGVLLTIILVGIGFYIARETKNTSNNGMSQLSSMNSDFQEVDKTLYDGLQVSGREVAAAITKYGDQLGSTFIISVKTLAAAQKKDYNTRTTAFPAVGADDYINPDAQFLGSVTYNSNNVVNGIVFTQQK